MPSLGMFDIGIVGNGLSGYLVLKHLTLAMPEIKVAMFNSDFYKPIEGPAYLNNSEANFFLNTPTHKIALSEDNVYEFADFLGLEGSERDWHFASRTAYGNYAKEKLSRYLDTASQFPLAIGIKKLESGFEVTTAEGKVNCQKILLATGNDFQMPWQGVIYSPWDFDYSILKDKDQVLVIGTGLTMLDIAGAIYDSRKSVIVTAISKSGLFPNVQPQKASPPIPFVFNEDQKISLIEVFRKLKENIKTSEGEWWRAVDGLRPVTISLWNSFTVFEKKQFMRHLLSKWNRVRHRAPQQVMDKAKDLVSSNRLLVVKGKVVQASANFVKLADGKILNADYVFYAGGAVSNPMDSMQPLWSQLSEEDWIDSHPCALGLNASQNFQLIGKSGKLTEGAFTIGNNMRGTLLECTAIPELNIHAKLVAAELLGKK